MNGKKSLVFTIFFFHYFEKHKSCESKHELVELVPARGEEERRHNPGKMSMWLLLQSNNESLVPHKVILIDRHGLVN